VGQPAVHYGISFVLHSNQESEMSPQEAAGLKWGKFCCAGKPNANANATLCGNFQLPAMALYGPPPMFA